MKKPLLKKGLITSILMSLFLVIFLIPNESSKREKYENYLTGQFENIEEFSKEELKEMPKPTRPDLAAIQNYYMTLDPELGRVPLERLVDAYHETKSQSNQAKLKSSEQIEWGNIDVEMGGRTRALCWDQNDPSHKKVWAGGVTGGLWYNNDITNDNSSWIPVDDFWPNLAISCITFDPNNSNIIYVGTGEAQTAFTTYRESTGVGIGIWKSIDGGNSWDLLPSTEYFKYITDIKVRNENGVSVIYAGVASGFYQGVNHQSIPSDGLYRSNNGGETFEQVLPNITNLEVTYTPADIEIAADGRIYIGTMPNMDDEGGATILMSDVGTNGNWTVFEDYRILIEQGVGDFYLPGRVMLAPAPSDENVVYAVIGAGYNNGFKYFKGNYILRSPNKGQTWVEKNLPSNNPNWASLSWHAFIISVDPNDANRVNIGGLDVYKSNNGGNSWYHVSDWSAMYWGGGDEYVHADQHAQKYNYNSSNEMIFGSDGGVFYTSSATNNYPVFEQKNLNYNTLQFYTCAMSPLSNDDTYVGGLQDNGTLYYTGSPISIDDMIDGGDGAYCFIDQDEAEIMISSVYYNSYTVFVNGTPQVNMGQSSGIFINPAAYDYSNNILYANAVNFFGNYQNRILRIEGIPNYPNEDYLYLNTGISVYFSHIQSSPYAVEGKSTLFLGSVAGHLFKVENAESSPTATDIGSDEFPTANISCIAIGGSEDTLLVTFSNYGVSSVWQTYDGGTTWQEKESNLPDMPIRWAIYHPQNSLQAMLATEIGIWTTTNLNSPEPVWIPSVEGMANVRVDMLKVRTSDNTVLAATQGRGLFTTVYDLESQQQSQTINVNHGYQFVSSHLQAEDPDMEVVVDEILENGLVFVRDSEGTMLRKIGPDWVNGIGDWIGTEAYLIKFDGTGQFTISGDLIPATTEINLSAGFQFVSYLPHVEIDAMEAFATIIGDDLIFVRNSNASMLRKVGPNWVNGIGNCIPTEGYLVKMADDAVLIYPEEGVSADNKRLSTKHFKFEGGNAADPVYTIYVDGLSIGDEVAAFDGKKLVGSLTIASDNILENELAVFSTICDGEGFESGNLIMFKIYDSQMQTEVGCNFEFLNLYGDAYTNLNYPIEDGKFSLVKIHKTTANVDELSKELFSIYPNPVIDKVNISLDVEKMSNVEISIFNAEGIKIFDDKRNNFSGKYSKAIDLSTYSSGIYFININNDNKKATQKIILQRP